MSTTGLEPLLIGPADLPAEFVVTAAGEETRPVEFCGMSFPDDLPSVDHTSITYADARSSTYLSQYLARVDPARAPENVAALRNALAGCDEWIQPSATGEVVYTIELLDVVLPGDGVAFAATSDLEGLGHIQTKAAIVNVGVFVTWIAYTEIGDTPIPPDALVRYVDIAERHLTNG